MIEFRSKEAKNTLVFTYHVHSSTCLNPEPVKLSTAYESNIIHARPLTEREANKDHTLKHQISIFQYRYSRGKKRYNVSNNRKPFDNGAGKEPINN